jgi:hypothetical protein
MTKFLLMVAVTGLAAGVAHAAPPNLLANPSLNTVGPQPTTTLTVGSGPNGAGGAAGAAKWTTWSAPNGTVTTEWVPSQLVPGGHMLRIKTTGGGAGLVQQFISLNQNNQYFWIVNNAPITPPRLAYACVWIRLLSGTAVGIGLGNGGNSHTEVTLSDKLPTWQRIEVSNGIAPATELIVYGGDAEFEVESAYVAAQSTPIGCQAQ